MSAETGYRLHVLARSMQSRERLIQHRDIEAMVTKSGIEDQYGASQLHQLAGGLSIAASILLTPKQPWENDRFRSGPVSLVPNAYSGIEFEPDDETIARLGYEPEPEQALTFHLSRGTFAEAEAALPNLANQLSDSAMQQKFPVLFALSYPQLMRIPIRKGMREVKSTLDEAAHQQMRRTYDAVTSVKPNLSRQPFELQGALVTTEEFIDKYASE